MRKQGALYSHTRHLVSLLCLLQRPHGSSAETHFYLVSASAPSSHGAESMLILYFNTCHVGRKNVRFSILNACLRTLNLRHTFYLFFFFQFEICNTSAKGEPGSIHSKVKTSFKDCSAFKIFLYCVHFKSSKGAHLEHLFFCQTDSRALKILLSPLFSI